MAKLPYHVRRFAKRYAQKFQRYIQKYPDPLTPAGERLHHFIRMVNPGDRVYMALRRAWASDEQFHEFRNLMLGGAK